MPLCWHCEAFPALDRLDGLALCRACGRRPGICDMYANALTESPLWTAHLVRLRRRAEAGLDLFDGVTPSPRNVSRGWHKALPRRKSA